MRWARENAPVPLRRTTASAERPGGVASAAMGSESMAAALGSSLAFGSLGTGLRASSLHLDDAPGSAFLPFPRQHPLLRNARDIAYRVIEIQPGSEVKKKERHHCRDDVEHHLHL